MKTMKTMKTVKDANEISTLALLDELRRRLAFYSERVDAEERGCEHISTSLERLAFDMECLDGESRDRVPWCHHRLVVGYCPRCERSLGDAELVSLDGTPTVYACETCCRTWKGSELTPVD